MIAPTPQAGALPIASADGHSKSGFYPDDQVAQSIHSAFVRLHQRLYTFAQEDTPVEIVTLRVDARGVFPPPAALELPPAGPLEDARTGTQVLFLETGRTEAAIYARERLGVGAHIVGPAILTQLDATTLLLPGQQQARATLLRIVRELIYCEWILSVFGVERLLSE